MFNIHLKDLVTTMQTNMSMLLSMLLDMKYFPLILVFYMLISNIIDYLMLAMPNMRKINCQIMSECKLDHFCTVFM